MKNLFLGVALGVMAITLASCADKTQSDVEQAGAVTSVEYEKYTLANGLDVILHVDRSDPIVAIDLTAHVGSAREVTGRTGFAHLFEHLLFLDSENLGFGGLDEMNTRIGGEGTNGYTTNDVTKYFQAVPKDGLEKIIWAEADKIGYFINTVTTPVLDKEKQVVKNEKRQRVDNVPYGHRWNIVGKAIYPEDHPYNWQVIGSLADLQATTLEDVRAFYKRWYVPNNVTVTIAGDFDVAQAKIWVDKYFSEIPRGADVEAVTPRAGTLEAIKSFYHEDNFATVPQLTLAWPSAPQFHKDSYALDILTSYLADGKRAPLNEVLIEEEKLTSQIGVFQNSAEIAGETYVIITAKDGGDLDALMPALDKAFARFEANGISQADLDKIIAGQEVAFYQQMQSVLNKAIQLGQYNAYTGNPGFINEDIKNIQSVTREDVMRVYNTYIKDKAYVAVSMVPQGQLDLGLEGAVKANIVEEQIVQGAEEVVVEEEDKRDFERTASSFDRTIEPAFGAAFTLPTPAIWEDKTADGIQIYGIESDETPLVYFTLTLDVGRKNGSVDKPAIASLTASMLEKGTVNKATAELEDAIKALGSAISVNSGRTQTQITGTTLARNFEKTIALAQEILLEPRWDEAEFDLLISSTVDAIEVAEGNPGAISRREWTKVLYPEDHIYSYTASGPKDKLKTVTLDDLKAFYADNYIPVGASFRVVGDVSAKRVKASVQALEAQWSGSALVAADRPEISWPQSIAPTESKIYFYDVPGAKQSVLRFGYPSLSALDADYVAADAMNYLLGNIYTSKLMTELRVNKGYTYGIGSGFAGIKDRGTFTVRSSVRANVTLEATQLIHDILENYGTEFSTEDLGVMKSALIKGQALTSETLRAKLGMLDDIASYGYAHDYRSQNAKMIEAMTLEDITRLTEQYLRPNAMHYLVVGDGKTQKERLKALGFGDPVVINP
ncbi:MAG: peptidase M16 [Robiginitomaculum sp.]|nr:MAG: peptidase M16 [Robiginitomaculum sp.]